MMVTIGQGGRTLHRITRLVLWLRGLNAGIPARGNYWGELIVPERIMDGANPSELSEPRKLSLLGVNHAPASNAGSPKSIPFGAGADGFASVEHCANMGHVGAGHDETTRIRWPGRRCGGVAACRAGRAIERPNSRHRLSSPSVRSRRPAVRRGRCVPRRTSRSRLCRRREPAYRGALRRAAPRRGAIRPRQAVRGRVNRA
jgi:hypothetical protein